MFFLDFKLELYGNMASYQIKFSFYACFRNTNLITIHGSDDVVVGAVLSHKIDQFLWSNSR